MKRARSVFLASSPTAFCTSSASSTTRSPAARAHARISRGGGGAMWSLRVAVGRRARWLGHLVPRRASGCGSCA
eukprot:2065065-Prymnesium_polylepis.2